MKASPEFKEERCNGSWVTVISSAIPLIWYLQPDGPINTRLKNLDYQYTIQHMVGGWAGASWIFVNPDSTPPSRILILPLKSLLKLSDSAPSVSLCSTGESSSQLSLTTPLQRVLEQWEYYKYQLNGLDRCSRILILS